MEPRIVTTKSGAQVLHVFYQGNNFDHAIEAALKKHGLKHGDVTVIAWPECLDEKMRLRVGDK